MLRRLLLFLGFKPMRLVSCVVRRLKDNRYHVNAVYCLKSWATEEDMTSFRSQTHFQISLMLGGTVLDGPVKIEKITREEAQC